MKLSKNETKIIALIGKGKKNREIAEILNLKEGSVAQYIYNLCRVTGATNRIELFNKLK